MPTYNPRTSRELPRAGVSHSDLRNNTCRLAKAAGLFSAYSSQHGAGARTSRDDYFSSSPDAVSTADDGTPVLDPTSLGAGAGCRRPSGTGLDEAQHISHATSTIDLEDETKRGRQ